MDSAGALYSKSLSKKKTCLKQKKAKCSNGMFGNDLEKKSKSQLILLIINNIN